jgi:hypothetical protein
MPTPFDELTLWEVDEMQTVCLEGKTIADSDPMRLAGAVMFMTNRRGNTLLDWETFRKETRMSDIKAFSELMNEEDELNPTNGAMS